MRAMDRIPRLETDDAPPPTLGEDPPRLRGVARQLGELRLCALEHRHAAGQVERLLVVQAGDARVCLVGRPEELGLALSVVLVDLGDVEDGHGTAGSSASATRHSSARRQRRGRLEAPTGGRSRGISSMTCRSRLAP